MDTGNDMERNGKTRKRTQPGQIAVIAVVIALTVMAWIYMAYSGGSGGMVMDMGAGDPSMEAAMEQRLADAALTPSLPSFGMFVPMWVAMCIAMMLPTALPMIHCMNRICERRKVQGRAYAPSWLFILGYVVLWVAFGIVCWVVAYLLFMLIGGWLGDWRHLWIAVGAVFVFGGVYQLSPLKNACLKGCQHPVSFIMKSWKEGRSGAFQMGMKHGAACVGCCAALMIVMFPLGMMNLVWMGIFTIIMFAEKNARIGTLLSKIVGWLLLVAGCAMAAISIIFMFI